MDKKGKDAPRGASEGVSVSMEPAADYAVTPAVKLRVSNLVGLTFLSSMSSSPKWVKQ